MSIHAKTKTKTNFNAPRRLAPTLANSVAMMGAPRAIEDESPTVAVSTFYSFRNLCEIVETLDSRFDRTLAVAIELPVHCAPEWSRLSRTAGAGGQLSVVIPPQSRITLPMLTSGGERLQIAGWDRAQRCLAIEQAIEAMLFGNASIQRCFILHPEWSDPTRIYSAIGRYITS